MTWSSQSHFDKHCDGIIMQVVLLPKRWEALFLVFYTLLEISNQGKQFYFFSLHSQQVLV